MIIVRQTTIGAAAFIAILFFAAPIQARADTMPANVDSTPAMNATSPDLDAYIDESATFDDLQYPVPANIDRRPAVLPPTTSAFDADEDSFPSDDAD